MSNNSEFVLSPDDHIMSELTEYLEIPSKGFNRIFKVKRYGQWFILKTLKQEFQEQTVYKQLLKKEFEIGIQLNHANIVRYMSFEPSTRYGAGILMEYIEGETLREYMRDGYNKTHNKKIIGELIDAIGYLHKLQLAHRDLKPENIMITRNGQNVKIIDFGLSDSDYYAIFKQPAGTAGYLSPEVIARKDGATLKQDLFALGKIIDEMMPNKHGIYGLVKRKCCNGNYDNIHELEKNIRIYERKKGILTYVGLSLFVVTIFLVIILNSDMYNSYRQIKGDMDVKSDLRAIIYKEIDVMYEDFEMLLDTNTQLLGDELSYILSQTIKPWPDKLDSLKHLVNTKELERWVSTTYSQYLAEKNTLNIQKIQKLPTANDLYESGEMDSEESYKYYQRLDSLYNN